MLDTEAPSYGTDQRNRVKRRHDRGFYDHETVHRLLDAAALCHVAYVVDGSSASRRPIRLGASSLSAVEILSGLSAGDRIVVSGTDQFDNADRVRISGN